jgi:hypothetical protein
MLTNCHPGDDDKLFELMDLFAALKTQWRELVMGIEQELVELFNERGSDLELLDGSKFYLGRDKRYKRRQPHDQVMRAIEYAILEGDNQLERTHHFLASDAWKPGACLKLLGKEKFDELFTTTVSEHVKVKKTRIEP